ncbi:T9SS type A sorting domain-containing protein, partial [bacterium]|nr:T9SS type A sorting domain-containing protein [bacterium]
RVAITEDDVYEPGTNGELYHDQAFRYMYPDTDGLVVPTTPGKHRYTVHCPVNAETWVYEKLRAVVYVQDNDTWKVHNAATGLLTETLVAVDDSAPALLTVKGNHPNPFNPETAIKYELSADRRVRLTIYDVDGSLVATLVDGLQTAGAQSAVWDGRDAAGRPVSSGAYFYRIDAGGLSETRKMVMVK